MPQDTSSRSAGKLAWVAPASIAVALVLLILGGVFVFRAPSAEPQPAPPPPPPKAAPPVVQPPPAAAPVTRADLIRDAGEAAANYATRGQPGDAAQGDLVNRPFMIRLPFGCEGPQAAGAAQVYYELDAAKRTVRLVAHPGDWTGLPLMQALAERDVEAVEGFWIPRPWRYAADCPPKSVRAQQAVPTSPATPSLGLAQIFATGDSRLVRHAERPYEHVLKLAEGESFPTAEGFRLVLEGRFAALPQGGATLCWSETPDHRPICIYAVTLSRVAFERADGRLLAEWRD